jgi:hypothetical protein
MRNKKYQLSGSGNLGCAGINQLNRFKDGICVFQFLTDCLLIIKNIFNILSADS